MNLTKIPVYKLICGGQHTIALASSGAVFTWGSNDEGALGRNGLEDKPLLVQLPIRITDVAAGGSHSIFLNSEENKVFMCGIYRVRKPTFYLLRTRYQEHLESLSQCQHYLAKMCGEKINF
jgi:alpha-tubulin suppressor-like RCC1 family protein